MRIGIDARFYGSLGKGLGRYTEKLIEQLERIDDDNEYVIFLRAENFSEYVPRSSRFHKVVAQFSWYGVAEQTLFVWLLYRFSLDLVHFPHFNVPLLYRRPFVVTIHDLILVHYPTLRNTTRFPITYWVKFLIYRIVIASAIARARKIITVSQFTAKDIVTKYPKSVNKIFVTYEAADDYCQLETKAKERVLFERLDLLQAQNLRENTDVFRDILKPYFLYVGNAYPHKNLSILFSVAQAFPQYVFVLVGKEDYFYGRLKEEVRARMITNVFFTGFLTDTELSALYRHAQAYLFPSLYEGFGLPPLESMSHGTPVISSNRGSLPEILGDAALYFDPTNPESLIEKLRELEGDAVLRDTLRLRGYRRGARYSFSTMAKETHRLYQAALLNKNHTHVTD